MVTTRAFARAALGMIIGFGVGLLYEIADDASSASEDLRLSVLLALLAIAAVFGGIVAVIENFVPALRIPGGSLYAAVGHNRWIVSGVLGLIPGILYGQSDPVAITIGERELRAAFGTSSGSHAVLEVQVDGGSAHSAILKDFQRDKVRGTIIHVDLQEVRLDQTIQTAVAVTLVGEPVGVREGGVLNQVTNEVNVEALPLEVPQHLEADVSGLGIGDTLRLSDVEVPDGVRLLDDPDETVIASVQLAREEPAEEPEEGAEEGEEGETPEGEAETAEPSAEDGGGEPESEG
jgi:large subunit ribosomal protein L25